MVGQFRKLLQSYDPTSPRTLVIMAFYVCKYTHRGKEKERQMEKERMGCCLYLVPVLYFMLHYPMLRAFICPDGKNKVL